jgi:hypothetical protein
LFSKYFIGGKMNKGKKILIAFILSLLFVPPTITILMMLSIIHIGTGSALAHGHVVHGIVLNGYILFTPIYTALTPYIAYEILKRLDDEST